MICINITWWPRWFVWPPEWPPAIPWWWWYVDITSCLSWVSGPGDPVDPGPRDPLPWPPPLPLPGPGDWWLWWWWCFPMSTAASTSALLSRPSLRPPNKSPWKKKKIKINIFSKIPSHYFNCLEIGLCKPFLLFQSQNQGFKFVIITRFTMQPIIYDDCSFSNFDLSLF